MTRNTYFPTRMGDEVNWLVNFINKLPLYATALGLSAAQVTAAVADALWLVYVMQAWLGAVRAFSLACTDAIATDLRIVGSEKTGPDYATLTPKIEVSLTATGVLVAWTWGGFAQYLDMIEIQVDRGDGKGWVLLTYDTTPGYTDTAAQPATPTKWKYRAIYRVGDQQVGQWSAEVSITVGG